MKINEVKHNHSLTDLLKVLLFALLMLAPIGSVATRCLYVVCNKNAYQSYSGTANEYNETAITEVKLNDTYHFSSEVNYTNTSTENTGYIGVADVMNIETNITQAKTYLQQCDFIRFYYSSSLKALYYFDENLSQIGSNGFTSETIQFDFRLTSYTSSFTNYASFTKLDINDNAPLDNVFEYSVSKVANDQIFSWTQNTPVYTGINAMCTQLGITGQAIPIILSYWLILTCIYVVIDIVLKLFTLLTHLIANRKAG